MAISFLGAQKRMFETIKQGEKLDAFGSKIEKEGYVYHTGWCGSDVCEAKLKPFKASIRCLIKDAKHKQCFACDKASVSDVIVAKSYQA